MIGELIATPSPKNGREGIAAADPGLGRGRASRVGAGDSPSRTSFGAVPEGKDCFGETPKPAPETGALPGVAGATTCLIGSPNLVANSRSRSSCAGTPMIAPVP